MIAYVTTGRRDKAREAVAKWEKEKGRRHTYSTALTYAALGGRNRTLEWLESTCATAPRDLTQVDSDAEFNFLRSDPRFKDLMRRAGIRSGQLEGFSQ